MRLLTLLALFVLSPLASYAQKQVLYYSSKWEITPKESATYFRVCNYNSASLFFAGEVRDYDLDSTLVMQGFYSNYGTKEGGFFFYYPSGKLQAQGSFKKNLRDGLWKYYFENGNIEKEVVFTDGEFSPVNVYDLSGNKIIDNGSGPWSFEYDWYRVDERYIIKGEFINGKRTGSWTCRLTSGELLYRETYKEGEFKRGIAFVPYQREIVKPFDNHFMLPYKFDVTEKFIPTLGTERHHYPLLNFLPGTIPDSVKIEAQKSLPKDTITREIVYLAVEEPAAFPGGGVALNKFIATNIKYPAEARRNGIQGKVFVKFIVEKDGSISDVEIMKGLDRSLNLEALRIVSLFPKWNSGKQGGEVVRTQHVLPITFRIGY